MVRAPGTGETLNRVLFVSHHADIIGGGELSLLALLKGLDKSRWAPVVVVPREGAVAAGTRALGLPTHVIRLPSLRRPRLVSFHSVVALRRLVRTTGAVLLHANGSRAMAYAGLAGRLAGRPVIWHVRVADRDGILDRLLAGLARAVIVNSKAVGHRFPWAPPGKVRCIYNGVDLTRFSPRPPSRDLRLSLGLREEVLVVGSIGRFVPFKGYACLLQAASLVKQTMPGVRWVLVGDGELRGELVRQCRSLGIEDAVHFTGWREDIPDILASVDLFVLPSLGEHFGRVLIEAMAMGKPIVATDSGGVPEIVIHGETGLLVPPAQPEALADAVLMLLQDPSRAERLGAAGRRRAEREFSLSRHAEAVEALYVELLWATRGETCPVHGHTRSDGGGRSCAEGVGHAVEDAMQPIPAAEFDRRIEGRSAEAIWREYYAPHSPARIRRQELLRAALAPRSGERVLDVGCGAGGLAYWAAGRGARVVGADYSSASLAAGKRIACALGPSAPAYVQADATRLPLRDGCFDKVICVDVLDHIPEDRHGALLGELLRAVRPGGRIILYTPNERREALGRAIRPLRRLFGAWRHDGCALHIGLAGPSRLRRLLRGLGAEGRLAYADMNYSWIGALPLLRGWLAGHMLWTVTRSESG